MTQIHASSLVLAPAETTTSTEGEPEQPKTWTQQHPWVTLLPFVLFFGVMYYMLVSSPQKRQARERNAMVTAMRKGDRVVTIGGIHGTVIHTDQEKKIVTVRVAKGVEMDFSVSAVSSIARSKEESPG
jgi:preprotein translocase subunit YajC